MGNLEKAGVLVVVALLAVILVVAFLNFPDQNARTPVLNASAGKMAAGPEMKPSPPDRGQNVYPEPKPSNDVIRPKAEVDHPSTDVPPKSTEIAPPPVVVSPGPKPEDGPVAPPISNKPDHAKTTEKPANANGYPKTVKVLPGESLWAIAVREYGAKVGPKMLGLIADANPKVRPEALKAGTELSLPAPSTEVADAKDTKAKSDTDKKPPAAPSGGAKATPASSKTTPGRKLPFVPGN